MPSELKKITNKCKCFYNCGNLKLDRHTDEMTDKLIAFYSYDRLTESGWKRKSFRFVYKFANANKKTKDLP